MDDVRNRETENVEVTPAATKKGFGLKKWKRIRRDAIKDPNSSIDHSRIILKRGLSEGDANLPKNQPFQNDADGDDSIYPPLGSAFSAGTDSENSDDSENVANSESTKKLRSEIVEREKVSDTSSSNFKQGIFVVSSNGKQSGRPNVCDEACTGSQHLPEDFGAVDYRENMCSEVKEEKRECNQSSTAEDPLIESICCLQDAQEALEEEIRKFEEIGNKPLSPDDDSTKWSSAAADISAIDPEFPSQSGIDGQIDSSALEIQVLSLTKNVNILESKSEELHGMLALKDSRISEVETALSAGEFLKEELACTIGLSVEKIKEVESELETLFRQKIEAEVEYLTITKMMKNLKFASAFTLLGRQEMMPGNQVQVPDKLEEVDNKDSMLKKKAHELEKYCDDILGVEETFMMQRRVCKLTFCLFMQFTLLFLVFWLFVSQLSPTSGLVSKLCSFCAFSEVSSFECKNSFSSYKLTHLSLSLRRASVCCNCRNSFFEYFGMINSMFGFQVG